MNDIYVIKKLCNLLQIESGDKEALEVEEGFQKQPLLIRKVFIEESKENEVEIELLGFPTLLLNSVNYYKGKGYDKPICRALDAIFPMVANLYGYIRARIKKDNVTCKICFVLLSEVMEKIKSPESLSQLIFELDKQSANIYKVKCYNRETITVRTTNNPNISGKNVLVIGMGGGSDGIQAAIVGKYLLKNCNNVISIRTAKTGSQDWTGKMNNIRLVYGVEKIISNNAYLCNQNTHGEGRFFEDLPARIGMNCYLIIDKKDGKLFNKIQEVIKDIEQTTGEKIDTIVGVDTGGDCLYPMNIDGEMAQATPDLDRASMETICKFEELGYQVYSSIVAIGIDSPNGITSEILKDADAVAYFLSDEEKIEVLNVYSKFKMDGSDVKRVGKTPLIWQAALRGKRGIVTINLPEFLVLSKENPWITNVSIDEITEAVIFMKTAEAIKAIKKHELFN